MTTNDRHDEQLVDDASVVNPVTDGEDESHDDGNPDEEPSHVHIQRPAAA